MIIYIGDTRIDARRLLVRFLINALALVVADALVPGIRIEGWQAYTVMAIVLGFVNAVAKPVLELLTCPLIILTLGLFLLVLNAAMLGLAAWIAGALGADVHVDGFGAAFVGAIIISIVSWLLSIALA
jgi:putative membrane protein